jgi:hypothetical protein
MLHQVNAIDIANRRVEIAGTSGAVNGWTPFDCVYGIRTKIADNPVAGASAKTRRAGSSSPQPRPRSRLRHPHDPAASPERRGPTGETWFPP